jgi:hypothetical protein
VTLAERSVPDAYLRLEIHLEAAAPGQFRVFVRILRALSENFSIGLCYSEPAQADAVILRVNGDHGSHRNPDGGMIAQGPHVHGFRGPRRDAPPQPGAEARWAWPLPPDHLSLPIAWRSFCREASVGSNEKVDKKMVKLHASLSQLALQGLDPHDDR